MEELLTRKRLTREESRAQTRDRLLEAASEVFVRQGIEAASIEEVAETAGYSRGAFYSNFESKDDLLCALLDREIERAQQEFDELLAAAHPPEELVRRVRAYYVQMGADNDECMFWLSLQMYALRHPAIQPRVAELMRKERANVIEQVRRVYAAIGQEPPGSPEIVAFGLMAVAQGLGLTQMLDAQVFAPEMLSRALEILFNRIAELNGTENGSRFPA